MYAAWLHYWVLTIIDCVLSSTSLQFVLVVIASLLVIFLFLLRTNQVALFVNHHRASIPDVENNCTWNLSNLSLSRLFVLPFVLSPMTMFRVLFSSLPLLLWIVITSRFLVAKTSLFRLSIIKPYSSNRTESARSVKLLF